MNLCGHATLASAHCLKTILNYSANKILFETRSGNLTVLVEKDFYHLDFPSRMPIVSDLPEIIKKALSVRPNEILKSRDYVLVYDTEDDVKNIKIDRLVFDQINLDLGGVIITAKGNNSDFVSRFCSLIPYWAKKLGKNELFAMQISERVGKLTCKNKGDRVIISGLAKTYSIGTLWTE